MRILTVYRQCTKKVASTGVRRYREATEVTAGQLGWGLTTPAARSILRRDQRFVQLQNEVSIGRGPPRPPWSCSSASQQRQATGAAPRRGAAITASGAISPRRAQVEAHQRCAHVIAMGLAWCFDVQQLPQTTPAPHASGFFIERGPQRREGAGDADDGRQLGLTSPSVKRLPRCESPIRIVISSRSWHGRRERGLSNG